MPSGPHQPTCQNGSSERVPAYNKQLERTVIRPCVRAACASFHCAHAARWTAQRAAAQLRRYASGEMASCD